VQFDIRRIPWAQQHEPHTTEIAAWSGTTLSRKKERKATLVSVFKEAQTHLMGHCYRTTPLSILIRPKQQRPVSDQ
jgi:hypothetical protein